LKYEQKKNNNRGTRTGSYVHVLSRCRVPPLLVLALLLIQPAAFAGTTIGNTFYWANITPQNDLYELAVNPGDTLLQGRSYDLTNVYGFSGTFAHWNDDNDAMTDCNPDYVINTSYIKTNGKTTPKNVYFDPSIWVTGDWYQWDGCFNRHVKGQTEANYVPYSNDNAKMFSVINYSRDLPVIQNWQNRILESKGVRGIGQQTGDNENITAEPTEVIRGK